MNSTGQHGPRPGPTTDAGATVFRGLRTTMLDDPHVPGEVILEHWIRKNVVLIDMHHIHFFFISQHCLKTKLVMVIVSLSLHASP